LLEDWEAGGRLLACVNCWVAAVAAQQGQTGATLPLHTDVCPFRAVISSLLAARAGSTTRWWCSSKG